MSNFDVENRCFGCVYSCNRLDQSCAVVRGKRYRMSNQMTLSDRIAIEAGITAGKTFKEIALKINRNPATVSREIKANRTVIPATFYLGCDCRYARSCHKRNICTDKKCNIPCIKCRIVKCTEFCPIYKPKHCSRIEKPPYVCNRCYYRNDCDKRRYMYSAKLADCQCAKTCK